MSDQQSALEARILTALRASHAPLREGVLYERVARGDDTLSPDRFLATLERLATLGHLRVAVEHEPRGRETPPFQPRFWRVVD